MTDMEKMTLYTMVVDFSADLKDIENLMELIHLGIVNSTHSERDLEDSSLRILESYTKSVHEKYVPEILDSLKKLS
jgi:hypothetical protein